MSPFNGTTGIMDWNIRIKISILLHNPILGSRIQIQKTELMKNFFILKDAPQVAYADLVQTIVWQDILGDR